MISIFTHWKQKKETEKCIRCKSRYASKVDKKIELETIELRKEIERINLDNKRLRKQYKQYQHLKMKLELAAPVIKRFLKQFKTSSTRWHQSAMEWYKENMSAISDIENITWIHEGRKKKIEGDK